MDKILVRLGLLSIENGAHDTQNLLLKTKVNKDFV